jgi:hypothetical protein
LLEGLQRQERLAALKPPVNSQMRPAVIIEDDLAWNDDASSVSFGLGIHIF